MARILVLSTKVTETCRQLVNSLRDQQHEVSLLTGYQEPLDGIKNINIMAYFKNWSLFELLRFLPHLIRCRPQIFHILLDEDTIGPSQILITLLAKALPGIVITTSLLHIKQGLSKKNPVRYLIEQSDIVTCPSLEALHQLRGLNVTNIRQGRSILPPALKFNPSHHNSTQPSDGDSDLFSSLNFLPDDSFVLMPFNQSQFDPENLFFKSFARITEKYFVVLLGTQQSWSYFERNKFNYWLQQKNLDHKWMFTGIDESLLPRELLNRAHAFFIAGTELTPEELTVYYNQIIQSSCPLVLDSAQSGVHPTLWQHGKNCWIISTFEFGKDLGELLNRRSLRVSEKINEQFFLHKEAVDAPYNELNRLYSRALDNVH